MNSRAIAALILNRVLQENVPLDVACGAFLQGGLSAQDTAFIKLLCFGSLRWFFKLEYFSKKLLHKPVPEKEFLVFVLLLVGLYQLFDTKVPVHAVIFSTVEAAKQLNKPWATGLLNRLLRLFSQEKNTPRFHAIPISEAQAFFAHPQWMIDDITQAYPDQARNIFEANNQHPPLWLRVNPLKGSRDAYLEKLKNAGIACVDTFIPEAPFAVQLVEPVPVKEIPGFFEGFCSVQDLSGQFLTSLVRLKPEHQVLDACAAPGSKTSLLLESCPDIAQFVALDKDARRLDLIDENLERLQLKTKNIQCLATTGEKYATTATAESFDWILLDAPCSSVGVIRRHPDIKVLRTPQDVADAARQQWSLLKALWPLLKVGGRLVYSTCSIFPDENASLIERWLQKESGAKLVSFQLPAGHSVKAGWQILPGDLEADGFFYCVLEKFL